MRRGKIGWRHEGERDREGEDTAPFCQCTEDSFGSWMVLLRFAHRATDGGFRARGEKVEGERKPCMLFEIPPHRYQGLSHVLDSMHLFSAG